MCTYDLVENDCIHCHTEEEARELFLILNSIGIGEWRGGSKLSGDHTNFEDDIGDGIYYFLRMSSIDNILRVTCAFNKKDVKRTNRVLEFSDVLWRGNKELVPQTENDFMEMML
ncbi:hypothetical protein [Bacteroides acidifaciens]|uniref:hypothetical protein n=1 Tax=Bacteroides acidifaciens TaxID=85831 RepID=UPI00248B28A6|nr:hypothetical protein [Bacteroides acidifaciens]